VTGQGSTNLVYTILGFKPSLLSGFIIVGEVHIIWYQSFGSKASLTIFYFRFLFLFPVPCCEQKKKRKQKKKKKRYSIPVKKFLPFNLVSHLIQVLDLFDEFWLFLMFELLLDYFELVS
jgi:hypothetical protein